MAFGTGQQTKVNSNIPNLFTGFGVVKVVAVNPTTADENRIRGTKFDRENVYVTKYQNKDGKSVESALVTILVHIEPQINNGIDAYARLRFPINKEPRKNRDNTKALVINAYGDTTWLPFEAIKDVSRVPDNMKWYDTTGMRVAYAGEETLTSFIKTYLNIPSVERFDFKTRTHVKIDDPSQALAKLEHVEDYFKGDVSEIRQALGQRPDNYVKVLFGVNNYNGKLYQSFFDRSFGKPSSSNNQFIIKEVNRAKEHGAYHNITFTFNELSLYNDHPVETVSGNDGVTSPWDRGSNDSDPLGGGSNFDVSDDWFNPGN